MLNCSKDYKRYFHISYHILDFVQQKAKFTMVQPYMLPILYCQYHACWYPRDLRSQGIIRHCIAVMKLSGRALALGDLVFKWTTWESKGLSQWANWKKCQLWANWKNGFNFNAHGLHCPLKSPTYDRKSPIQWKGFPDKILCYFYRWARIATSLG